MYCVETLRLGIRCFTPADADMIYRLSVEDAYRRWLPDQVYTDKEQAREALDFLMSKYDGREFPYVLAVVEKSSGDLIGHVGLSRIPEGVEIGYAIGYEHQGRGYATEAVAAFSDWAKKEFSVQELFGVVRTDNTASRKVLEKAGFATPDHNAVEADTWKNLVYQK